MDMIKKSKPILYDQQIIGRVKQYLEENVHQTYVDVSVMAKTLQERYSEYNRRKSVPFRQLVEQAYKTVLHSYGLDSNPSSDGDDNSDLEVMDDMNSEGNHMNNILTNMYTSNKGGGGGGGGGNRPQNVDAEVIGISSDDDSSSDDDQPSSGKNNKQLPKSLGNPQIMITKVLNDKNKSSHSNYATSKNDEPQPNKRRKLENNNFMNAHGKSMKNNVNDKSSSASSMGNGQIDIGNNRDNLSSIKLTKLMLKNAQESLRPKPKATQIGRDITIRKISELSTKKFKREVFATSSLITFEDLGGMDKTLVNLCELLLHIKHPEVYKHIGLPPSRGFLLHGPPGSGKTLLAQAIAGQLNIGLIQLTATELIAGVSGESEELIRELFEQAACLSPCVLFIDEIDAISSNRINAQKDMERRIVSQLLSSFDGLSKLDGGDQVLVIGATNRPDALDPALRRIGRFDQEISLGIPDRTARSDILKVICGNLKLEFPFKYDELAALTPGYVGADLVALATRAASLAVKRAFAIKQEQAIRQNVHGPHNGFAMKMSNSLINDILELDMGLGSDVESVVDKSKEQKSTEKGSEMTIDITDETLTEGKLSEAAPTNSDTKDESKPETTKVVDDTGNKDISKDVSEDTNNKDTEMKENVEESSSEKEPAAVVTAADGETDKVDESIPSITESDKATDEQTKSQETDKIATSDEPMAVDEPTAVTDESAIVADEPVPAVVTDDSKKMETSEDEVTNSTKEQSKEESVTTPIELPTTSTSTAVTQPTSTLSPAKSSIQHPTTNSEIIEIDEEDTSLTDAMLQNQSVRTALELDVMIRWLSDTYPTITKHELENINITMNDFIEAISLIQPSAKREGFITVPDVTWNDIGSLRDIRNELQLAILAPVKYPKQMESLGLYAPSGVLLCGPPGCGKTLLAKAVANEAGINFISVKGPELLNMYVGESERAVRQCFQRARNSSPCVIFFDEFDALCPKRSDSGENNATSRVVNQLLTEMDGIEGRKGVYLMAATNRPDIVDPAVMRPGRFDKVLYVGMPNENDRSEILQALTKKNAKSRLANNVDINEIAAKTENFTGADLAGLVREAAMNALRDLVTTIDTDGNSTMTADPSNTTDDISIDEKHFTKALQHCKPSVSEQARKHYEKLREKYAVTL